MILPQPRLSQIRQLSTYYPNRHFLGQLHHLVAYPPHKELSHTGKSSSPYGDGAIAGILGLLNNGLGPAGRSSNDPSAYTIILLLLQSYGS